MKIYVDKLPTTCDECPCRNETFCSLTYEELSYSSFNYKRGNECPLELIAEHDKEKDRRIAVLERALEWACEHINAWQLNHEPTTEYFIDQAEKELKDKQ